MQVSKGLAARAQRATTGRLFVLELSGGRIFSIDTEGRDKQVLVTDCRVPDGIGVDVARGHIYWTNMGHPEVGDGSIERVDLDGGHRRTIVPSGITYTPKQLQISKETGKLYWADREGMRVMRCNVDGTNVETLVASGSGDAERAQASRWCVGIAVDPVRRHVYWTQKGADNANEGRIFRAGLDLPAGDTPSNRSDIELLYGGLPEPIDLELDVEHRTLYWTDRGDPPSGNSVNRAPMDVAAQRRGAPEIVFSDLMEGIGIALDVEGGRIFVTDVGGSVYASALDGSNARVLMVVQGNLAGIAYAQVPVASR
ncbi:3-hydroxyacyl-CoA dehydrogenase [Piscinibacter sp. XHJ-5]|uniref:3-hydroxyacyl-CoA dehydrogenase n=1 Tax=Piscinibacter sp. XHJ-5 TaxID=3037797 RepID=UPI0024528538|nr:3-hydroxyacyl-CoA dehydrogenase [Piscinibacter sp. XHJ-5]